MNKAKNILCSFGRVMGALFVFAVVLAVPLLSFKEAGSVLFDRGQSTAVRVSKPLPVMNTRAVDATTRPVQLFEEPLITVTFADGHESIYSVAMPILQKHGIRTTQYVLSGTAHDSKYVSWDQMKNMQAMGHELACHTSSHANLTTLNDGKLDYELQHCKQELTGRFGLIDNFASPYGAYNARTSKAIGTYFSSHRTTHGDPYNGVDETDVNVGKNFDQMQIIAVTVRSDTSLEHIRQLVEYARKNNGWLVLTYHQANDPGSIYALDEKAFEEQFAYLSGTDLRIVTVQQALEGSK